jgi:hypothetical protein
MNAILTPYAKGNAAPAGRNLFRKQLLPVAKIDYKGRVIDFTRDYLAGLVTAFNDRAYDQVAFQLADEKNTHTEAPERFRGEIAALELTVDGLDVIVAATDAGAEVLRENPRLGVSAKIVEGYGRADGKFFPRALKHVLGTLDPRLTGMRPWEAVEAANDDGEVIDLTDAEYGTAEPAPPAGRHAKPEASPGPTTQPEPHPAATPPAEEHDMALTPDQETRLGRLLDLPDDKFEALLADKPEEELLTDAELEALLAGLPADPAAEPGDGPAADPAGELEPAGAALSAEAQAAIELANQRAEEQGIELARITQALDRATYEKERDALARDHGIPPRITDLARPLLEGAGRVVELANGSADAGQIVRKLLAEIGKTVKMLDLTGEIGSPLDFAAEAEAADAASAAKSRADLVSGFRQMTGV